jgi:ElaB/YqjD/DUF883 family membrane-anchored ribosome-binding protein
MSAEQKSPEQIRKEIAETRADLGDTVEALSGKTDVKGQAKAKVDSASHSAKENPVPIAVAVVLGLGLIVGLILARRGRR